MNRTAFHQWWPIGLGLASVLVMLGGDPWALELRYERTAVLDGEWWRVLTGHFSHLGWSHLGMNLAGLGLAWLLVGSHLPGLAWIAVTIGSALGVTGGLLLFSPELTWYVGLSGILHGLIVAGAAGMWAARQAMGPAILVILAGKLGFEQAFGPLPGSTETAGGDVIVDAHLYGALGGLLVVVVWIALNRTVARLGSGRRGSKQGAGN